MKTKHTPGLWYIRDSEVVVDENGECIAMWATDCGDEITPGNLRLISAAPDLLDALDEMIRMYEAIEPGGGWQGVYECAVMARKKATE